MRLRLRVALASAAVILPALALVLWARVPERESAIVRATESFALARIRAERAACELAPETWPAPADLRARRNTLLARIEADMHADPGARVEAHVRGDADSLWTARIRLYALDGELRSRNPATPAVSESMRVMAATGASSAHEYRELRGRPALHVLLRTPWASGPCAFVLAQMPGSTSSASPLPLRILLPATLLALAGAMLSMGPVVRRIRQLTREVQSSLRGDYGDTVTVGGNDEIGELARAFAAAAEEVRTQTARQAKREHTLRSFLENTTHDVMIPLTVLQGHLVTLQQRAMKGELLDAASIAPAMNEAHYMASLMHNLAMAAKLEAGEPLLQREPVNLNEAVERAVGRHAPSARQRVVGLERAVPEPALWARGDVTSIEQALSNLVYNAIRYNREHGHVAVVLERHGSERFLLRVVDDGPGIPEHERSQLIERHFRGNAARSREPAGRGLGLNIAFRVTEVHGWTLALRTSEFGGLEVEIEGALCESPASVRLT